MMLNIFSFLLGMLVFRSQAVLSAKFDFRFSEVQQCEPVSITFFGDFGLDDVSMTLTVLPFDSQPVVIPIPNAAPNCKVFEVAFLPLPAGTAFIASLDDGTGRDTAEISDVIHVLPSPTNNSMCLPPPPELQHIFQLGSDLEQCKELTVNYDTNVVSSPPSVRLFSPGGRSFQLNLTSDDNASGTARYTLQAPQRSNVLLLINGGGQSLETTDILTVMEDSSSDASCLPQLDDDDINAPRNVVPSQDLGTDSAMLSKEAIIALSAGGGVVGVVALCMLIYIIRERRRRRVNIAFDPSRLESAESPAPNPNPSISPMRQTELNRGDSFIQNPPYTSRTFVSPATPIIRRSSTTTWSQILPQAEGSPRLSRRSPQQDVQPSSILQSRMSISSLDIEGILNMATVHSNRASRDDPTPLGPVMASDPPRAIPQALIRTRQHFRDPPDVPRGASSMLSSFTNNPFGDDNVGTDSHVASRLLISAFRDSGSTLPSPVGLPVSPRSSDIVVARQRSTVDDLVIHHRGF